jgi:hypothetical protein
VRWAKRNRYILVCHDGYKERFTRQDLYPELHNRGGQVIRVTTPKGRKQDPLTVVGKIIASRLEPSGGWRTFFDEYQGIATVGHGNPRFEKAEDLFVRVQQPMDLAVDPVEAMKQITPPRKREKKPRPRHNNPDQMTLTRHV